MFSVAHLVVPCITPVSLLGYYALALQPADSAASPWARVIELGIGGVIVFLVTAPLVRWLLKRLDTQQEQTERLITALSTAVKTGHRDSTLHARALEALLEEVRELREELSMLPDRVASRIARDLNRSAYEAEPHNPKE